MGRVVSPPLVTQVCVASSSGSIFARFFTLVPRSLFRKRTETLALAVKLPLFFLLVNFSPALFNLKTWNNRLPWNLHLLAPGSVLSYLSLFVCLFLLVFVKFYVQGLLLCVLLLYVSHWHANKLFHFPRVKVLCPLFYVYNFSNISRDTSCDSVRPIKAFLHMNRDGSCFLCKNPFNFFGKFSNF